MRTIILPGFSIKNREWAEEIKKNLDVTFPTTVYYWKHWETNKTENDWINQEAQRVLINTQEVVNIIAKSIGTVVAMVVLKLKPDSVNKIILCGVPIRDFLKGDEKYYEILTGFPSEKFICFQNKEDKHGSYKEVKKFLLSINQKLDIVSKPRSDHEYPYAKDFMDFLRK
jgi:predicted alpha/beta hydrolase family esterase